MIIAESASARVPRLLSLVPWLVNRQGVDIDQAARELGVSVPNDPSVTEVVVGMDAAIEAAQRRHAPDVTDLSEMAKHAAVAALHGVIHERLPALWAPVGLRYHALHHLLPSTPYHSLAEAHRRLHAHLGGEGTYVRANYPGLAPLVAKIARSTMKLR